MKMTWWRVLALKERNGGLGNIGCLNIGHIHSDRTVREILQRLWDKSCSVESKITHKYLQTLLNEAGQWGLDNISPDMAAILLSLV